MGEVIDISALKPHSTGPVMCTHCRHEWIGAIPTGTFVVECPECKLFKGVRKGFSFPDEYYTCGYCEGFLFIKPTQGGTLCVNCGDWADE